MTTDSEELKVLPSWARRLKAGAWLFAKVLGLMTPVLGGVFALYNQAVNEARARAQSAKQLAEDGYQVQRHAVEALQERVRVLEAAAKRIQAETPPPRRRSRPLPPAPTVRVTEAKPLPKNLDMAKAVVSPPSLPSPQPTVTGKADRD